MVYGLGFWVVKGVVVLGVDLFGLVFWMVLGNVVWLGDSVLMDVILLMNIGIIGGVFLVVVWCSGGLN